MKYLPILLILLVGSSCKPTNYYSKKNLDRLFFKIEQKETKQPEWLTKYIFVTLKTKIDFDQELKKYDTSKTIDYVLFYENCTSKINGYFYHGNSDSSAMLKFAIETANKWQEFRYPYLAIVNDTLDITHYNYLEVRDMLYYINKDSIFTRGLCTPSLGSRVAGLFDTEAHIFVVDSINRNLTLLDGPIWPRTANRSVRWKGEIKKVVFKGYPFEKPNANKNMPLMHWHPFRRWKAHLDSINAGLIPPDVYVNSPK
jgi:hypothetical protein